MPLRYRYFLHKCATTPRYDTMETIQTVVHVLPEWVPKLERNTQHSPKIKTYVILRGWERCSETITFGRAIDRAGEDPPVTPLDSPDESIFPFSTIPKLIGKEIDQ